MWFIALIYTLLICWTVITALTTQNFDRRKVAVKVLKILAGPVIPLSKAEPSREAATEAEADPRGQAALKEERPQHDRTGILVSLWIGVVTCMGVFVAAAALAHGLVMVGGMAFGALATVITAVWFVWFIRATPRTTTMPLAMTERFINTRVLRR
jgi:Flp pilus assembly protein TadB